MKLKKLGGAVVVFLSTIIFMESFTFASRKYAAKKENVDTGWNITSYLKVEGSYDVETPLIQSCKLYSEGLSKLVTGTAKNDYVGTVDFHKITASIVGIGGGSISLSGSPGVSAEVSGSSVTESVTTRNWDYDIFVKKWRLYSYTQLHQTQHKLYPKGQKNKARTKSIKVPIEWGF